MRDRFIMAAKLLGLYFFYWSIVTLLSSLSFIATFFSNNVTFQGSSSTSIAITSIITVIPMFVFSLLLMFKTQQIADWLKLSESNSQLDDFGHISILRQGMMLVGIYLFITDIGKILKIIFLLSLKNYDYSLDTSLWIKDFIEPGLIVVLSLFLIFTPEKIENFLTKENSTEPDGV